VIGKLWSDGECPSYLQRFVEAQDGVYDHVLDELRRGQKTSHWMWFVFPQLAGLGRSAMAQRYALASIAEARAYRHHPVLGARLTECLRMLNDLPPDHSAIGIFGDVDAMKLRSSLTMFDCAGGDPLVDAALQRWFRGVRDGATLALIG
jgi:uncharacterized protein (DUF1810 family)